MMYLVSGYGLGDIEDAADPCAVFTTKKKARAWIKLQNAGLDKESVIKYKIDPMPVDPA